MEFGNNNGGKYLLDALADISGEHIIAVRDFKRIKNPEKVAAAGLSMHNGLPAGQPGLETLKALKLSAKVSINQQ